MIDHTHDASLGDPAPLPYLFDPGDQAEGAFDLELDVLIQTEAMRRENLPPHRLARSNARQVRERR